MPNEAAKNTRINSVADISKDLSITHVCQDRHVEIAAECREHYCGRKSSRISREPGRGHARTCREQIPGSRQHSVTVIV